LLLIKERKHYLLHKKTIDKFKPPLQIMNVFAKKHVLIKEHIKVTHLRTKLLNKIFNKKQNEFVLVHKLPHVLLSLMDCQFVINEHDLKTLEDRNYSRMSLLV
jgi:hypothetical protein